MSRAEALVRELESRILSGEWARGDRLGTREDLRVKYGVAAATVSETIRMLESRGLVETRPGNGGESSSANRPGSSGSVTRFWNCAARRSPWPTAWRCATRWIRWSWSRPRVIAPTMTFSRSERCSRSF
ncbi:FadR/GntR family transcriptional regulator [Nonomuraea antimicrobica]